MRRKANWLASVLANKEVEIVPIFAGKDFPSVFHSKPKHQKIIVHHLTACTIYIHKILSLLIKNEKSWFEINEISENFALTARKQKIKEMQML